LQGEALGEALGMSLARARAMQIRSRGNYPGTGGLLEARQGEDEHDDPSAWPVCCAASARGLSLFGERAGQPPLRLVDPSQAPPRRAQRHRGRVQRARRPLPARADHPQLERFVRYLARPPIARERLELLDDRTVRYGFGRAWKDGSTAVDLHAFDRRPGGPVRPTLSYVSVK